MSTNVDGNVYDKHLNNGGIYASALTPADESLTGVARYDGLHIHHCRVERCRRWGIAAGYTYQHGRFTTLELPDEVVRTYGSVNVVIEHNRIREIGGDAIYSHVLLQTSGTVTTYQSMRPLT